jgi:hypothetical protein
LPPPGLILFAFLLTLSFTDRFAGIDDFQRGVYAALAGVFVTLWVALPLRLRGGGRPPPDP